jgi:hypothetical protein
MQRTILSVIAIGLLLGCTAAAEKEAERLSMACQLSKCDCISNTFLFADTEPVQWKPDGAAYCRDGYHLRRLEAAPTKPM